MKNKKLALQFQIFSIIFISILGTLLHFTYQWSNYNALIGAFSAVNESTWEHLKLLFFPTLITIIIGCFYLGKNISNFLCAKTLGIAISSGFIIVFFFTYTGILGTNLPILNIASFFISVVLGEYIAYIIMLSDFQCNKQLAIVVLIILSLCFIIFTFMPPKIGLFNDPLTGQYVITSRI